MDSQLSSKKGINPKLWGPHYWKVFHITAFAYPDNPSDSDKDVYRTFYKTFAKILPCDKCSISARKQNTTVDWDSVLQNRDTLIRWTYDYHDLVNAKIKKESPSFTYFLNNFIANLNKLICNCNKYKEYIVIFVLIAIIVMQYTSNTL